MRRRTFSDAFFISFRRAKPYSAVYFVDAFTCEVAAVVASTAAFFAAFFLELNALPTAAPALVPAFAALAVAVVALAFAVVAFTFAVVAFVFASVAQHFALVSQVLAFASHSLALVFASWQQAFATAVPALQHSFFTVVFTVCALAEVPKHTVAAISAAAIIILFIVFTFLLLPFRAFFRPLKYWFCHKRQAETGLIMYNRRRALSVKSRFTPRNPAVCGCQTGGSRTVTRPFFESDPAVFRSFALTLHKLSCTRQSESGLSLRSFALTLH